MFRAREFGISGYVISALALGAVACGSTADGDAKPGSPPGTGSGGAISLQPGGNGNAGGAIHLTPGGGSSAVGSGGSGAECGVQEAGAKVTKQPVDIILVIDNSGSMEDEIVGVQSNINDNFAAILGTADIDYRVILIARHGVASSNQSICITAPLSGAASCEPLPEAPIFTERFYQYNMKIDSNDTFDKLLGGYAAPILDTVYEDKSDQALMGWSAWLRAEARKVFVEITDDDPEGMTWEAFDAALLAAGQGQFGTASARNYVWHSIVGIDEKPTPTEAWLPSEPIVDAMCGMLGGGDDEDDLPVVTPGRPYQELSKLTGGLRFPICEWASYDAVFQRIATDVISRSEVACDFAIPAPPAGNALDLDKVAVSYAPGGTGARQTYAQAPSQELCQAGAFFISGERIYLCPETCQAVQADPAAAISVLFTCESTIIVK